MNNRTKNIYIKSNTLNKAYADLKVFIFVKNCFIYRKILIIS